MALRPTRLGYLKMKNNTGIPSNYNKPHLGDLLLKKYRGRICTGFDDLKKFELIDRLEKPVLDFTFSGSKNIILEVYDLISQFPYAFIMRTNKGYNEIISGYLIITTTKKH